MASGSTGLRYGNVAIVLHWTIAGFILFNLATGLTFDLMARPVRGAIIPIHISSGITVLVLTIVRIGWRLTHRPPPYLPMARWERVGAKAVHVCLYLAMLGLPLTGWAMISAHNDPPPRARAGATAPPRPRGPTLIWGVVPLPKIAPIARIGEGPDGDVKIAEAHEQFEGRHGTGGWILLALVLLHVAGALKHQLIDKERELARMGIGRRA